MRFALIPVEVQRILGLISDKAVANSKNCFLPAIVKSFRIQEKVRGIGFDWDNKNQVWDKVLEEIEELKVEIEKGHQKRIESEFGDVLFALTNYSRFIRNKHF